MPPIQRLVDPTLQEPRKQRPRQPTTREDRRPLPQLLLLIPAAQDPVGAHKRARLEHRLEEADNHDLLRRPRERRAQREHAPDDHARREPEARPHELQREVVRELAKDVPAVEDGVDLVELRAVEAQVLAHAGDVRVGEVRAVEVVDPVHEADEGEDDGVGFEEEGLLQLCSGWGAPEESADGEPERERHFERARRCWIAGADLGMVWCGLLRRVLAIMEATVVTVLSPCYASRLVCRVTIFASVKVSTATGRPWTSRLGFRGFTRKLLWILHIS